MSRSISRRSVLRASLAAGGLATLGPIRSYATETAADDAPQAPTESIGVGIIGAGGRGGELSGPFSKAPGARIVAVADPDSDRAGKLATKYDATAYTDLRRLLEDPAVDVVAIATCNHWHCLAAIMAMQAGKDVYVEKPLSHTQWEGRQVVNAARKFDRIVQLGTQQRSDPMQAELKQFLHDDQQLGAIQYVQANRLGVRGAIGRRERPLSIPNNVDYDLWLGPASDQPIYRDQLHYDWHWDFNTGSGEMGNWGVHILDDVRNVAYRDSVSTPSKIMALGGRVVWDDAGNTPNVHYAIFETESFPTVIVLSNLEASPDKPKASWSSTAGRPAGGPSSGYVVACDGGYLLGQRGRAKAIDRDGKTIQEFRGGDMVPLHVNNFVDAVRNRNREILNAEIAVGHDSTGWCNLANVGFQTAKESFSEMPAGIAVPDVWQPLMTELESQLKPFGMSPADLKASPVLTHNPKLERFEGDHAEAANAMLRRQYRTGFEVPSIG
jgi:predicted dehydrogenase